MKSFLADFWRFVLRSPEHPVYRHEMNGWSHMKVWRSVRKGCLPIMALFVLGTTGCCGLTMSIPLLQGEPFIEFFPLIVLFALIGLLMGGQFIMWVTSLLATALTATAISSELEAETYGLLRLTSIPPREVVLAKFGASLRQLRAPLIMVVLVRVFFLIGLALLATGILTYQVAQIPTLPTPTGITPLPVPSLVLDWPTMLGISGYVIALAAVLVASFIWLIYWLVSPWISLMLFSAVGMLGSVYARTRSGGLLTAFGIRVLYWMVSYIASQFISTGFSLLSTPLVFGTTMPLWLDNLNRVEPSILIFSGSVVAVLWIGVLVVAQFVVVWLLLGWASQRAGRLPYTA